MLSNCRGLRWTTTDLRGPGMLLRGFVFIGYDTIRYDAVYLTCSQKLTGSQLNLLHKIKQKI